MTKQNSYNLVGFFCAVGWLSHFGIAPGFAWACWLLVTLVIMNVFYTMCNDDKKDDDNPYNTI